MELPKYKLTRTIGGQIYWVDDRKSGESLFRGTLADCSAWIQLKTKGYLDEN